MKAILVNKIGWLASSITILVFLSYIDQIRLNVAGQKGSALLPFMTIFNCITWSIYGFMKPVKDWPLIVCNIPGIVLATVTFITAII